MSAEGAATSPTNDTVSSMPCVHTSAKLDRSFQVITMTGQVTS